MSFPAKYASTCQECYERINEEDLINMVNGKAVHDSCPMGDVEPQKGKQCNVCFLIHPEGSCDRQ